MDPLIITDSLSIALSELEFSFACSGGPGGQNVNKVNSKAILRFDLIHSPSLSDRERIRIQEHLASRLTAEGILQLTSQTHRTQLANRQAVTKRFVSLLQEALFEEAPRLPTKPTRSSQQARLQEKRHQKQIKQHRKAQNWLTNDE